MIEVSVVILPESSIMSLASVLDPMRAANRISGREVFRWRLLSADGKPVVLTCGVPIAVEGMLHQPLAGDALLVIGAPNSSNSKRLVEVGRSAGCDYAQLVMRAADIDWRALEGIRSLGVTAGASAPEVLVNEVIDAVRARYDVSVEIVETAQERVEFKVPRVLRA